VVTGYTIILVLDKVLFDTHALFSHDENHHENGAIDPAEKKLKENLRESFANMKRAELTISDPDTRRKSMVEENQNMEKGLKEFLNP